jgi:hypothetical protein
MGDRWGEDPTAALWERWRRPGLILVGIFLVIGQWDWLTSGSAFGVATGIGASLFWISWLLTPAAPKREQRASPAAWRRHGRRSVIFFGFWLLAACMWTAVAATLYGFRPGTLVAPVFMALFVLVSLIPLLGSERLAEKYRELEA